MLLAPTIHHGQEFARAAIYIQIIIQVTIVPIMPMRWVRIALHVIPIAAVLLLLEAHVWVVIVPQLVAEVTGDR